MSKDKRSMTWINSVLEALIRYSDNNKTKIINRNKFLTEEFDRIRKEVASDTKFPRQVISVTLQKLRNKNIINFICKGEYKLLR